MSGKLTAAGAIVGRRRELARLDAALGAAAIGSARAVLVAGDAGIGKTAVLRAFEERSRSAARCLHGECTSVGQQRPFGPFVDVLREVLRGLVPEEMRTALVGHGAIELARLIPELATRSPAADPLHPEERYRSHESFAGLFRHLARSGPLVVVIEDLQWADEASLELFALLARKLRAVPALVVGSYRTDEMHRGHPLRAAIAEMERAGTAETCEIGRLDADDQRDLIATLLSIEGPLPPKLEAIIEERGEGIPFFIEEVLRTFVERGALVRSADVWRFDAAKAALVPRAVTAIMEQRLDRLDPPIARALRVAAVIGQTFEVDLLKEVLAADEQTVVAVLRAGIDQGIFSGEASARPGTFAFRHALLREAVLGDLLMRERQHWHRRIARAIEGRGSVEADAEALAYHLDEAGERGFAARYHELAAVQAISVFDTKRAVSHFERAIALTDRTGTDLADLYLELSKAAGVSGGMRTATRAAEAARDLAAAADDERLLGRATLAMSRAAGWSGTAGARTEGMDLALAAAGYLEPYGPSEDLAAAFAVAGYRAMILGRGAEARTYAERALEIGRSVGSPIEIEARVLIGSLMAPDPAAVGYLEAALHDALAQGAERQVQLAFMNLAFAHACLGEHDRQRELYFEAAARAKAHGLDPAGTAANIAHEHFRDGDWDDVVRTIEESENATPTLIVTGLFIRAAREGPETVLGELERRRERFLAVSGETTVRAAAATAQIRWLAGDAAGTLNDASALMATAGLPLWLGNPTPLCAILAASELGDAGALDDWRAALGTTDPPAEPAAVRAARGALRAEDAARAGDLDAAIDLLAPLAPLYDHGIAKFGVTLIRLRRADLLLRRDHPSDRSAAAAELSEIVPYWRKARATWYVTWLRRWAKERRLPFPKDGSDVSVADGLSTRERQVAELVAEGLTDREIAERLVISRRTAEGHVERIRDKLGVRSRAQIGTWIASRRVVGTGT